jgi:hypothetical protein
MRSAIGRRFKDLLYAYEADAGGHEVLSQGQLAIIRRIAMLQVQLELLEQKFALAEGGIASQRDLLFYQRTAGQQRRLIESVNLHHGRIARDITTDPLRYAQSYETTP